MWKMVWDHKIQSLFQMEKQSGIDGIALIKPKSVDELAVLNSVIRLMASDKNSERPLDLWAKYRSNIKLWYNEMKYYGLTDEEIAWLGNHNAVTDGICESQEGLMSLVQEPRLGGNSLNFADRCRKGIAKKQGKLFEECEKEFYTNIKKNNCSEKLAHYVWDIMLKVQRGYSFNRSHCLAYSLVALQEMNLAYKFPLIYWNTACLITDTGGNENNSTEEIVDIYEPEIKNNGTTYVDLPDRSGKVKITSSTNYDKLADGINKMQQEGIQVYPPDINKATYTFKPDEENNKIVFGFRGILGVGNDIIDEIIEKRPFKDLDDLMTRTNFNKKVMVSLIKSGALDSFGDRMEIMHDYIDKVCEKKKNLNLQNLSTLMNYHLLPTEDSYSESARVYNFNKYLKSVCKNGKLTDRAVNFLIDINHDSLIKSDMTLDLKDWKKVYDSYMNLYRIYIIDNKQDLLVKLNNILFEEEWNKYAKGNLSSWEMETICYYYHNHELAHINKNKYGIEDFYSLPSEPKVDKVMNVRGKEIKLFKLTKICGTCISKNKAHGTVKILTTNGIVDVRFGKEYFSLFDRTIKLPTPDGKNKVADESWFNRGSLIMVTGIRNGDTFIAKTYKSTNSHKLYKIEEIDKNGDIIVRSERAGEE